MLQQILNCCSKQLSDSNYTLAEIPDVSAWSTKGYWVYWKLCLSFDILKFLSVTYSLTLIPMSSCILVLYLRFHVFTASENINLIHFCWLALSTSSTVSPMSLECMMWTHFHIALFNPEDGSSMVLWNTRNAVHFQTGSAPKNRINTDRSM
jgi:hypothetical protein